MAVHTRVLMVCLGNICRSPTAEGVLRHRLQAAGLADQVMVDSAGTAGWHAGAPPDPRSVAHALKRGVDLRALRARAVEAADFSRFDLILAMDAANLATLRQRCPRGATARLGLLMDCAPGPRGREVPDPYDQGPEAFETVLDRVELACDALVDGWRRGG